MYQQKMQMSFYHIEHFNAGSHCDKVQFFMRMKNRFLNLQGLHNLQISANCSVFQALTNDIWLGMKLGKSKCSTVHAHNNVLQNKVTIS